MTHNRFFDEHQRDTIAARYGLDDPDRRHAGRTGGGAHIGNGCASSPIALYGRYWSPIIRTDGGPQSDQQARNAHRANQFDQGGTPT